MAYKIIKKMKKVVDKRLGWWYSNERRLKQ